MNSIFERATMSTAFPLADSGLDPDSLLAWADGMGAGTGPLDHSDPGDACDCEDCA